MLRKRACKDEGTAQWSSGVILQTPIHIVMVKEDIGRDPIYFKFPGGRRRPADDTPEDTAIREALEETGIRIYPKELNFVLSQNRGDHIYYLYTVAIAEERLAERYRVAKNGEEVHVLRKDALKCTQAQILPHHFKLLQSENLALEMA